MNDRMNVDDAVIVALGSNQALGAAGPQELLEAALSRFPALGLNVVKRSRWWRSKAWPDETGPAFVNGVAWVETRLSSEEVMAALHGLEAEFGRVRKETNAPRTLDLDLIAYGRITTALPRGGRAPVLPHPRAHERLFVMGPLAEIAPDWRHPVNDARAADLAEAATVGDDARPM